MRFNDFSLDSRIIAGVQSAGYTTPTPIQEKAIPVVLKKRDVLGLAQTGTGKTAAFILPMLQLLSKQSSRHTRALIIAPTRELAEQIHQTAIKLGKKTGLRSATVYGGVGKNPQLEALKRGTDIIVACPGRLLDILNTNNIDFSHIEMLVLDEADRMCDMGFLPDIRRILKRLPAKRQTLFFAATMPKEIRKLSDKILHNPVTVQIGMIAPTKTVSHALYPVPHALKTALVIDLLRQIENDRVIIFTRTKYRARNLARKLSRVGFRSSALQGNMSQNQRQRALGGFRKGQFDILVATDIAARGIDVSEISHVINFDMPDTVDAYIHRIGRTGRAKASGKAFTFCVPDDEAMIRKIEKTLGKKIKREYLADFDYKKLPPKQPAKSRRSNPSNRRPTNKKYRPAGKKPRTSSNKNRKN